MTEPSEVEVTRRIVTRAAMDRSTVWLLWAVAAATLMVVALVVYGLVTGGFARSSTPHTAQENTLGITERAIRENPTEGSAYAVRAETLYGLGRKEEAFEVLDQGERAVGGENPALLYILRARTALLNSEGKYAEAEEFGLRAMAASDDYLGKQGAKLTVQGVTGISGNMQTKISVNTAVQLAAAFAGQEKWDKAIEMYTYALRLDPLAGDLLTLRGFAYLKVGDKAKAKGDFEQTLEYLPGDPDATRGIEELSK